MISDNYRILRNRLKEEMNDSGFWTGRLSSSALSTAVAIVALKLNDTATDNAIIKTGYDWLCRNINQDGGYGDTPGSVSNVSTTLLSYAAINLCQENKDGEACLKKMESWLKNKGITIDSDNITGSILRFYGNDFTFSVPILSMLTLCRVLPVSSLEKIPVLPFELTLLPASLYRFFNLRVVSYALPALIGVGIYLHCNRKKRVVNGGIFRGVFIEPTIEKLNSLVPESGGFLEAIPLTGFVAMCLIASGRADNKTVVEGLGFLRAQQRSDGSWPIDTDLSTWVTTLTVKALGSDLREVLGEKEIEKLRDHLISLQYKKIHPFNGSKPGGWGWTNFSGSVPDADDTPGAILALLEMYNGTERERESILNGCRWLLNIQNNDGGFPTFCKGWGKLPFDRSCADLTGHALLALLKTSEILHPYISPKLLSELDKSILKATLFLTREQCDDGSWTPLWFGNQYNTDKSNPVYGTAKVGIYLSDCLSLSRPAAGYLQHLCNLVERAREYMVLNQNGDGSWGGSKGIKGTVEETSLAVSLLSGAKPEESLKGIEWLSRQEKYDPSPIGLYFAMLWYDEKLYPMIYYTEALRRFLRV